MKGWNRQINIKRETSLLLGVAFFIFAGSLFVNSNLLTFITCLYLTFYMMNYFYLDKVGNHLYISFKDKKAKIFAGEESTLTLIIEQRSFLPIFLGRARIGISKNIEFLNGDNRRIHMNQIDIPFSLLWKKEIRIEIPYTAISRGTAVIPLIDIDIFHFWGLGKVSFSKESFDYEVIVYPNKAVVLEMEKLLPKKSGHSPHLFSLYEDNTRVLSSRDYVNGDSFNRVHWKSTAKLNKLQTKIHEKTSQLSLLFVIDVHSNNLESCLEGIYYIISHTFKHNISFSIMTNVKKQGKPLYLVLPPGNGKKQIQLALLFLAKITSNSVTLNHSVFMKMIHQQSTNFTHLVLCLEKPWIEGLVIHPSLSGYFLHSLNDAIQLETIKRNGTYAAENMAQ
ncbi:DUF58 domain-containing protein [Sutcliffiella deserti]|uniref:DUF58 domain-containing protein n=1 Tax=Sutcliffiella deserti TaxID=2875501 RepID=UPI001CBBCA0E|nr:DUF58 domain-containing protein [Sutcliffiella deserti]